MDCTNNEKYDSSRYENGGDGECIGADPGIVVIIETAGWNAYPKVEGDSERTLMTRK